MTEQDPIPILESLLLHEQPIEGFLPVTAIQKEIERIRQCRQSRLEIDEALLGRLGGMGEVDEYDD